MSDLDHRPDGKSTDCLPLLFSSTSLTIIALRNLLIELPPVWPWRDGETRGIALEPLYKTAPAAALRDPVLYQSLALLDAIRDGRARERKMAERHLINRLRIGNVKHNLDLLMEAARLLKPLLGELVFVGGSAAVGEMQSLFPAAVMPIFLTLEIWSG